MKKTLLILSTLILGSCASKKEFDSTYMEAATLWVQNAAEVRAMSYQAFNLARYRLDESLKKRSKKKRAVVVDVDETVLDNSPYQAKNVLVGRTYTPETWDEWVKFAKARPIPGAVEFLNYANKRGVEVFYITNRKLKNFEATYQNLKKLGFPVKKENMLLKNLTSSKVSRRKDVQRKHNIVLLMGDVLSDFTGLFDEKSVNERNIAVDQMRKDFGKKFIVLPNPMYGDWEWALHNYDFEISEKDRAKERKKYLYSY